MGSQVQVDKKLVQHVASLANLELTEDELNHYENQLGKVLGYIAQLAEMPDDLGNDFRADTLGGATPERPDVQKPSLPAEEALAEAPKKLGTAFQVPRIIE